jgi:transcriptional regulator with XRE-family HTH domain
MSEAFIDCYERVNMTDHTYSDPATLGRLIGDTIRNLRESAGLSMRELAERAGLSQPFLSQIERGLSSPSMASTYRLAQALGVRPGDLMPAVDPAGVTVVRATEGVHIPVSDQPDSAVGRALLLRDSSALEVVEYVIEPGQRADEWFESAGECGLYVISGHIDVEVVGSGTHHLGPRDFISFPAGSRDRWKTNGDQAVHLLLTTAAFLVPTKQVHSRIRAASAAS